MEASYAFENSVLKFTLNFISISSHQLSIPIVKLYEFDTKFVLQISIKEHYSKEVSHALLKYVKQKY